MKRGRVVPADRPHLRAWLPRFAGQDDVHFALEGCTGWRYIAEELAAAGITPHLAEPADTAALRGKKRHAKTDKTDTRHLRAHLMAGNLPECWIPPEHVLEARAVVRLYKDLLDKRGALAERTLHRFAAGRCGASGSKVTAGGWAPRPPRPGPHAPVFASNGHAEHIAASPDQRSGVSAATAISVKVQHCGVKQPLQAGVVRRADRQISDPLTAPLSGQEVVRNVHRRVPVPPDMTIRQRKVPGDCHRLHGAIQHPGTLRPEPPGRHKLVVGASHQDRSNRPGLNNLKRARQPARAQCHLEERVGADRPRPGSGSRGDCV